MRAYRSFGIPGIDMLCNRVELSTAKQAQSVYRQYGKEEFVKNGGKVIFVGDMPKYTDAKPSDEICELYNAAEHADMNRISVLEKLSDVRTVSIKNADASPTDNLIYQMKSVYGAV